MSAINEFDIAFIIDTTASMGRFIHDARREMQKTLKALADVQDVSMRVGIVEYRDHPPEDRSFVTTFHQFSDDLNATQRIIERLDPSGGGDAPEAVLDGIVAACKKLEWREHARRIAVLIGDAPPHGYAGPSDRWSSGCPCKETLETVTALAEETCIRLFSIPLYVDPYLTKAFKQLALLTGGGMFPAQNGGAMQEIRKIVEEEFGKLPFDIKVHDAWHEVSGEISATQLAERFSVSLDDVYESLGRLGSRNLLDVQAHHTPKGIERFLTPQEIEGAREAFEKGTTGVVES